MFTLHMKDEDGYSKLFYDQHTNKVLDKDGFSVFSAEALGVPKVNWGGHADAIAISPEEPGLKSRNVKRLKIQVGLGCNYSCSYCLQGGEILKAAMTSTRDAKEFLAGIDEWLIPDQLERIEIWGGEPLAYWKKIEILMPELKRRFPNAQYSIITNGSLLTREIVDWLYHWKFSMAISHDGPGHAVRGPDPLLDPEIAENIKYCYERFNPERRLSFNAVLTPGNCDVEAIMNWFEERFPDCLVGFEGVVHDYNGDASASFTDEKLKEFTAKLYYDIVYGDAAKSPSIQRKLKDAVQSLVQERPSRILTQKCGMDQDDSFAVDLKGNVITCQNVGGHGPHKIGTVTDFDNIRLNTSWHWSKREECSSCPVLQFCQGACMYQTGNNWVNSCNAEFAYNMAFFAAALKVLTGRELVGIDGPMIRPVLKKSNVTIAPYPKKET